MSASPRCWRCPRSPRRACAPNVRARGPLEPGRGTLYAPARGSSCWRSIATVDPTLTDVGSTATEVALPVEGITHRRPCRERGLRPEPQGRAARQWRLVHPPVVITRALAPRSCSPSPPRRRTWRPLGHGTCSSCSSLRCSTIGWSHPACRAAGASLWIWPRLHRRGRPRPPGAGRRTAVNPHPWLRCHTLVFRLPAPRHSRMLWCVHVPATVPARPWGSRAHGRSAFCAEIAISGSSSTRTR